MPMIDVYAAVGTFSDKHKLAEDLANAVMRWEKVPPINLFKKNTAAFVHDLPAEAISNAAGDSNYGRVQVLTPVGVLDRHKQLGVVRELTDIIAAAANDPALVNRTWGADHGTSRGRLGNRRACKHRRRHCRSCGKNSHENNT